MPGTQLYAYNNLFPSEHEGGMPYLGDHKVRKLTADEVAALPDDVIAAARAFLESCKREAA